MKKFIAILLTVMMILSVAPLAIFATAGDPIKIVDAQGNDVATYATLQTAVDAVTEGQKIVILKDYTLESFLQFKGTYNAESLKNVVIEGAEKADGTKVKITCAKGFSDQVGCYNLTVRNLNIVNEHAGGMDVFMYDPYSGGWLSDFASPTLTIDNCEISSPSTAVFKLLAQKNNSAYKKHNPFIIKIKDSAITAGGAAATSVICVPWNTCASVDVSVENSTITAVGGNATAPNPETSYIFTFNPIKGGVSDFSSTCNLTVDGTSKLIANFTGTVTPTGGIFNNIGGTATVTLEKGAELYVNNGAEKTQNAFILNTRGNLTLNDKGAVWKVGENTAKTGVTLPTFTENGETHVWYAGEALVANPYQNANASGDTVLTHGILTDPSLNPNNVCYYEINGEKVYYTDMKEAIAAAPDGVTIEVIRDFSINGFIQWFGKNVIIDGNGKTITGEHASYMFDINRANSDDNASSYTFTLKDTNVVGKAGMWFNTDFINIENCTFNTNGYMAMSYDGAAGVAAVINIKNTTWNFTTDGVRQDAQPFMLMGKGRDTDITFNLENSKIIGTSGNGTSPNPTTPNNGFFNVNTTGEVVFNMDATSVLKSNGATTGSFFALNANISKFTLDLAEGATMEMSDCMANGCFIANPLVDDKMNIVDKGAHWVIGANAAKAGISLPKVTGFSWVIGGQIIPAEIAYVNTEATENVEAILYNMYDHFSVMQGAGLKISGDVAGIAFGMTVSDSLLALLGGNVVVGVYIVPEPYVNFVANETLDPGRFIKLEADVATLGESVNGEKTAKFAISGIPLEGSEAVFVDLAAVGYITYTTESGETVTLYTSNSYATSLYELATKSKNQDSELVKKILALNEAA